MFSKQKCKGNKEKAIRTEKVSPQNASNTTSWALEFIAFALIVLAEYLLWWKLLLSYPRLFYAILRVQVELK